jgi:hypothetical protein
MVTVNDDGGEFRSLLPEPPASVVVDPHDTIVKR